MYNAMYRAARYLCGAQSEVVDWQDRQQGFRAYYIHLFDIPTVLPTRTNRRGVRTLSLYIYPTSRFSSSPVTGTGKKEKKGVFAPLLWRVEP